MNAGRPLILMYHAFGAPPRGADPHSLFVTPADLDAQLTALLAKRRPLDLNDYLSGWELGGRWPARRTVVTIDDGFRSTLEVAAPILQRRGVPAVVFALPGLLDGVSSWMSDMANEPLLDANDLRELARQGLEIGCHGWRHELMPGRSDAELRRDTTEARDALADATGRVPRAFAYPDGQFDKRAMQERVEQLREASSF